MSFKTNYIFNYRLNEFNKIITKYPNKIPVICERNFYASSDCPYIDKNKFLVPEDFTVRQFIYIIRKRLILQPEIALFIYINNIIPVSSQLLSIIYEYNKDPDGFLYITYSFENTFG